jgi:DNA ligase 1
MKLAELVETSKQVSSVSGRLEKVDRLAALLRRLDISRTRHGPAEGGRYAIPDEIDIAVAFLVGSPRQGRIGMGGAMIRQAHPPVAAATPVLELREVDEVLERIATRSGAGSTTERVRLLRDLLARATPAEQDFLVRLLFGELRQGALEGVMAEAISKATQIPAHTVRRAAMMAGDLGAVAGAALTEGEPAVARFIVQLFRPVQPMLAQSAGGVDEALQRLGDASLEYKIDGARVQVHRSGDEAKVFSRHLRDVTAAVPEVVETALALPARELILEGEVVALRPDGTPHPFQITMRRFGRRLDVELLRARLPLTSFFFDALHLDGQPLIDESQAQRFATVTGIVPAASVVPHVLKPTADRAESFLHDALRRGHEGAMAKALEAGYAAGSRGQAWLKIKQARTLDLVVLAAEWGHGRRTGRLSNLHLGARDPERNAFVMLGKTFKGLTDEMLAWQTSKLLDLEIARDEYTVFVHPQLVVEIAFNDLQESPHYPGGLALRFARVKRYRRDKTAAEADTFDTIQGIYRATTGEDPPPRR